MGKGCLQGFIWEIEAPGDWLLTVDGRCRSGNAHGTLDEPFDLKTTNTLDPIILVEFEKNIFRLVCLWFVTN